MWALSTSSVWGRVTWVREMLASPGLAVRVAVRAGLPACLVEPESLRESLGAKGREAQLATWKWEESLATGAFVAADRGIDGEGIAVGRVEGEVGAVEVDEDLTQAQRDALEDLRQRIGDGGDLGGFGIDA